MDVVRRGSGLRDVLVVLHFDELGPRTPQLPCRRFGPLAQLATSALLHATMFLIAAFITFTTAPRRDVMPVKAVPAPQQVDVRHMVFLASALTHTGGGGGGGGNQQPGPVRRAQRVGSDAITLRVRKPGAVAAAATSESPVLVEDVAALPALVLDATSLAAGVFDQIGLPNG